jgi:hypothetical protein
MKKQTRNTPVLYGGASLERLKYKPLRISINAVDEARYNRVRDSFDSLKELEGKTVARMGAEYAPFVVRDLYTGLNQPNVSIDARTEGQPVRRLLDWVVGSLERLPTFREIQDECEYNAIASALGTHILVEALNNLKLPEPPDADADKEEEENEDEEQDGIGDEDDDADSEGGKGRTKGKGKGKGRGGQGESDPDEEGDEDEDEDGEDGDQQGGDRQSKRGKGGKGGKNSDKDRGEFERPDGERIELSRDGNSLKVKRSMAGKEPLTKTTSFDSPEDARARFEAVKQDALKRGFAPAAKETGEQRFLRQLADLMDSLEGNVAKESEVRRAARRGIREALEDIKNLNDAFDVSYGDHESEIQLRDPDESAVEIARLLMEDQDFAKFMRIIGRYAQMLRESNVRERVPEGMRISGSERTDVLANLQPHEVALMLDEDIGDEMLARAMSTGAQGRKSYKMRSKALGPVHIMLDTSGSMNNFGSDHLAFAAAAILFSIDNNRPVSLDLFNVRTYKWEIDIVDTASRIDFIRRFFRVGNGGGTDFIPVVEAADKLPPKTDVLLISDGNGRIDPQRCEEVFRRRDLHYIVLGPEIEVNEHLRIAAGRRFVLASSFADAAVAAASAAAIRG